MDTVLRVAVCDDDSMERAILQKHIMECGVPAVCTLFASAEELLKEYYAGHFDLVIMDIYMMGMDGVEAVNRIREKDKTVPVAFATSSKEHALDGFRMGALCYLEKPILREAVTELLRKAVAALALIPHLEFTYDRTTYQIPFNRIMYAERQRNLVLLYLEDGSVCKMTERLDDMAEAFEQNHFFRSHQSYYVNPEYVQGLDTELMTLQMRNGAMVHVTRRKLPAARTLVNKKQDI